MKKSKKGFTLVEMLVVIAIIAVLVAIIVPTVTSSTKKAKAATDAANLRSAKATATIMLLEDSTLTADDLDAETLKVPAVSKSDENDEFTVDMPDRDDDQDTGVEVNVYYGSHAVEYYASIAEGADTPDTSMDKS